MRDDGKKIIVRPASKASVDCSSGIAHLACFLDAPAFASAPNSPVRHSSAPAGWALPRGLDPVACSVIGQAGRNLWAGVDNLQALCSEGLTDEGWPTAQPRPDRVRAPLFRLAFGSTTFAVNERTTEGSSASDADEAPPKGPQLFCSPRHCASRSEGLARTDAPGGDCRTFGS
ncbi:hypothetical protein AXG93_1175s1150 [Marchantia polymorpha subsp. ruderalis]|uniref:Uncharacterized protein n=1 Tax=Marchantia polymorpha subsp. ruderalis TaxID=1480154 RepID=A0A176VQ63_MARPO|nr:hypothetical protein AXG93_1175s1150 [Marchantia polymorpha subsp. ruderalis]